jgi:hypothetical protein
MRGFLSLVARSNYQVWRREAWECVAGYVVSNDFQPCGNGDLIERVHVLGENWQQIETIFHSSEESIQLDLIAEDLPQRRWSKVVRVPNNRIEALHDWIVPGTPWVWKGKARGLILRNLGQEFEMYGLDTHFCPSPEGTVMLGGIF